MARRRHPVLTMTEPPEVHPLEWAASGAGGCFTPGQKRYDWYRPGGIQEPKDRSALPDGIKNPFKVRGQ